VSHQALQLQ